jgi:two-component system LytT family response regulator
VFIRTLIVDDEAPSVRRLKRLLEECDEVEIVGTARDGAEAVRKVEELKPDLMFLDIEMPVLNGLEVMARLRYRPVVVFTTGHMEYSDQGFDETDAFHFMRKPLELEQVRDTLARVRGLKRFARV